VEGLNFDIRKQLLEFDDVANDQRKVVYQQRYELLQADDIADAVKGMREDVVEQLVEEHMPEGSFAEQWDLDGLEQKLRDEFGFKVSIKEKLEGAETQDEQAIKRWILGQLEENHLRKEEKSGAQAMRELERNVMLQVLDSHWREQLAAMDHLRQGIHLRGYAQKNPAQEFKRESFNLFTSMLAAVKFEMISLLSRIEFASAEEAPPAAVQLPNFNMQFSHADFAGVSDDSGQATAEPVGGARIGRNDVCHCGSGKKYKHCHGKL
jgi:preprotein translocase subunit SecA